MQWLRLSEVQICTPIFMFVPLEALWTYLGAKLIDAGLQPFGVHTNMGEHLNPYFQNLFAHICGALFE